MDILANLRFLWRRRSTALAAAIAMALALGANTAAFSVLRAFLYSSLALPDPDRLVLITPERDVPGRGAVLFSDAYPNYELLRQTQRVFSEVTCFVQGVVSWDVQGEVRALQTSRVSASFFTTMGVQPALGRGFTAEQEGPSPDPVAVVSHAFWRGALAGDLDVVGRSIRINGDLVTIIGVMPDGFTLPYPTDLWQPFDIPIHQRTAITGARLLNVYGRIAEGRTPDAVAADLAAFTQRTLEANPVDNRDFRYVTQTLRETLLADADATVLLIQGGAAALLLLVVLNLGSLLIAWGFERSQELAVRLALGAHTFRVVRLLVVQSMLVVAVGFVAALGLAQLILIGVRQLDLGGTLTFFLTKVRLDRTVLLLSAAAAAVAGMAATILPIWVSSRSDVAGTLKSSSRGATLSRAALWWQKGMVVTQSGLSVVVLAAAVIVGLSFRNLARVPGGFSAEQRAVARVTLPDARFASHSQRVAFATRLLAALDQEAELTSFGFTNTLPVGDGLWGGRFYIPATDGTLPADPLLFHFRRTSPDYLRAMGIPLLAGRLFTQADDSASLAVAILSQSLAAKYWPDGNAVGQRFFRVAAGAAPQPVEIVGVVGDAMDAGFSNAPGETVYVPYTQMSVTRISVVGVARGSLADALAAIGRAIKTADPILAAETTTTLDALVQQANALPRLRTSVLFGFAVVAVVIVGLGCYGVMRQLVAAREREFAVRLAFGAQPAHLGGVVLTQVAWLAVPGVLAGLGAAWLLADALRSFVFGIGTRPVSVLVLVGAAVLGLAVTAAIPSVARAMRTDVRDSVATG